MNWIKGRVFRHDPDDPLIFHRKDILGRKGVYGCLADPATCSLFDRAILRLADSAEYTVITALIDKAWLLKQKHWEKSHPYHYLMEILVEKYAQFLERQKSIGDIMPEARLGKKDDLLQASFKEVKGSGTDFVSAERIHAVIRSDNLKFRTKKDNVAGLQMCDLIAHPSHIYTRMLMKHDVSLGLFSSAVSKILVASKYDRSTSGKIVGYGIKHLPQ